MYSRSSSHTFAHTHTNTRACSLSLSLYIFLIHTRSFIQSCYAFFDTFIFHRLPCFFLLFGYQAFIQHPCRARRINSFPEKPPVAQSFRTRSPLISKDSTGRKKSAEFVSKGKNGKKRPVQTFTAETETDDILRVKLAYASSYWIPAHGFSAAVDRSFVSQNDDRIGKNASG